MTTQGKQTLGYVLGGLGLVSGTIGIFYASKKGYGGWGKFGMFLLFASPFSISAGAIQASAVYDKENANTNPNNRTDAQMVSDLYNNRLSEAEMIAFRDKLIDNGNFCSTFPDECETAANDGYIRYNV